MELERICELFGLHLDRTEIHKLLRSGKKYEWTHHEKPIYLTSRCETKIADTEEYKLNFKYYCIEPELKENINCLNVENLLYTFLFEKKIDCIIYKKGLYHLFACKIIPKYICLNDYRDIYPPPSYVYSMIIYENILGKFFSLKRKKEPYPHIHDEYGSQTMRFINLRYPIKPMPGENCIMHKGLNYVVQEMKVRISIRRIDKRIEKIREYWENTKTCLHFFIILLMIVLLHYPLFRYTIGYFI